MKQDLQLVAVDVRSIDRDGRPGCERLFGHKISNVTYRYEVYGNGKWTTLPAIAKAFPEFLQDLGPAPTTKMILVLTSEGWVSDYSLQTIK